MSDNETSCRNAQHRDADYAPYKQQIKQAILRLIENEGVTQFFSGGSGNFDIICARTVFELKSEFPKLKNILVFSHYPNEQFKLPEIYDESVYLLVGNLIKKFPRAVCF